MSAKSFLLSWCPTLAIWGLFSILDLRDRKWCLPIRTFWLDNFTMSELRGTIFFRQIAMFNSRFHNFHKFSSCFRILSCDGSVHSQSLWACWCLQAKLWWVLLWMWGHWLYRSSVSYLAQFLILCSIFPCSSGVEVRTNSLYFRFRSLCALHIQKL